MANSSCPGPSFNGPKRDETARVELRRDGNLLEKPILPNAPPISL
ncbi:MAG TPA: hypothetical protein VF290_08840 [Pyrinomonadaceae bacterium]